MSLRETADERFVRALAAAASYRARRHGGNIASIEEWLQGHEDLRELLDPMLAEDADTADERAELGPGSGGTSDDADHQRFAHFRILGSLGGGGMGDVYLALDERLGRKVALKMIRPEALWSQDAKLRFHRETLAIGGLDHPNICKLYEAGEHRGRPYMALQYIEGETLAQALEKARAASRERGLAPSSGAPATRALISASMALIEQVARALHHAHERGLVHRDIKPGNVMLAKEEVPGTRGQPIVLDFGLVYDERSLEASLSSSRRGVGTPLYMSPEQIRHTGRVDAGTDVYSLGVTLYECVTHARPFEATTEAELADKILANRYESPCRRNRQLPPELGLVIACALDRDPQRRYRTALAFAEDLRRVIDRQPVHARPIGAVLRAKRWAQRNPTLLGVSALLAVSLLGALIAVQQENEAQEQQRLAATRADEAEASLHGFGLLSDVIKLTDAQLIEPKLYPALPQQVEAMQDWLRERGEPLAERLPMLETALTELRKKAPEWTQEIDAPVDVAVAAEGTYTFAHAGDRFLHQTLSALIRDLRVFVGEDGALPAVRERLSVAESVHQRTIEDHQAEWDEAIAAIAKSDGIVASRLYEHLVLAPQVGLVPIGMDPKSMLWEFAHLASGESARRDLREHCLVVANETGIVFVLIPGGTFGMGAQSKELNQCNFDPDAEIYESPVQIIDLVPYFLSKFELTQAQWSCLTDGENPSCFKAGTNWPEDTGHLVTPRDPVESVHWYKCDELLTRQGLLIPTEAQWEYACRAGTTSPWWTGDQRESLRTPRLVANLADQAAVRVEMRDEDIEWPELEDGYGIHAPVGNFEANWFGLFDICGNVSEWCRDRTLSYTIPMRSGDGFRIGGQAWQIARGGDFVNGPGAARSAARTIYPATAPLSCLGIRPSRSVDS